QRILRCALTNLLTGRLEYKQAAMSQMQALFDPLVWPEWMDQSHRRFGHPADLRTGMLGLDVALAFDWLVPSLSQSERDFIIAGLDKKGIQPFLTSVRQNPWWTRDLNNWLTVIVGGFGMVGMALGDAHPQSQKLIEISLPLMEKYMSIYGPDGEFNESVSYANATRLPAMYYLAQYYWSRGGQNRLAAKPFPETCRWTMYFTLPPGRVAAFGDAHVDAPVETIHFAAIAAATRDPVLQWFYLYHASIDANPLHFLWYDATLSPEPPDTKLSLGKSFSAHGKNIVSRTTWHPNSTPCVVYGKAGREENHEHNDIGQLCIDGYGERLIVDLGSPSGYPADFFDEGRWFYYNTSIRGHNVLMFGGREMRTATRARGEKHGPEFYEMNGRVENAEFNRSGGSWLLDLTPAYESARQVRRAVIHLFPGIIAVLDEAELDRPEVISLRWHTIDRCAPDSAGRFLIRGERAKLSGRIVNLEEAQINVQRKEHEYKPPYHLDRLGEPLEQRRESYVEATTQADRCRLLTLFSVYGPEEDVSPWEEDRGGWSIKTTEGQIKVHASKEELTVANMDLGSERQIQIAL
ncbi:heparinase II/III family protein, partial [bacterium]|nr:heparinase II/III family protein [bacterium]